VLDTNAKTCSIGRLMPTSAALTGLKCSPDTQPVGFLLWRDIVWHTAPASLRENTGSRTRPATSRPVFCATFLYGMVLKEGAGRVRGSDVGQDLLAPTD
jgi:hypothetical protein